MTVVVIHDAMAVLRARMEADLARFSLRKTVNELNASPHINIWVWDGAKNKAKRQEIFPQYKANRIPAAVSIYEGMMLMKEVLTCTRGITVEVPGYEGDDAIAAIVGQYAGKMPIAINTVDFDLRALCALHPSVTCTVRAKPIAPDHLIQFYKTWVGDPSDNIPGVKGFGVKSWTDANKDELIAFTNTVVNDDGLPEQQSVPSVAPKHYNWIAENVEQFRAMWQVIGFLPIPTEVLDRHTIKGVIDNKRVDDLLSSFFL